MREKISGLVVNNKGSHNLTRTKMALALALARRESGRGLVVGVFYSTFYLSCTVVCLE